MTEEGPTKVKIDKLNFIKIKNLLQKTLLKGWKTTRGKHVHTTYPVEDLYHKYIKNSMDVSREQHRNMYIICGETDHQPRLDAWDKCSDLVHWEDPEGSGGEGGGRGDLGEEYMYIHGWFISMYDKTHYNRKINK